MGSLYGIFLAFVAMALFIYPILRILDCFIFGFRKEDREREYKILASEIVLTHEQMLTEIQETRRQMGMDPLPNQSIAAKFNSRYWNSLVLKIRTSVKNALDEMFWRSGNER